MTADVTASTAFDPPGIRLGVVRGISYGLFGPPGEFVPQARELGAGLVRSYLYWGQVEPEPGRYTFQAVDALLSQLDGGTEAWVTLCSSSPWATRQPTDFLPPSPAHDQHAYGEFVRQVVRRCAGRVRYWQCDNEPSNTGLLWAGTAAEYVTQLRTMYRAVKDADPAAAVVLGGCGYDVLSSEPGSPPRQFFEYVTGAARDAFDLFSVHLYGDLARVPDYLGTARQFMQAHGYLKPVVVGEHACPQPFEFPEAMAVMQEVAARAFSADPAPQSTGELAAQVAQGSPERRAMDALYARIRRPPAPAADVPGRLPGGAGGQAAPDQLPSGGDAYPARAGRRRPPDRLLEPRARGARPGRPPAADAPADRQASAAGVPGRPPGPAPPGRGHLRPAGRAAGGRPVGDPRAGARAGRGCTRSRWTAPPAGRCSCSGTTGIPSTARTSPRSPSAGPGRPRPPP